MRFFEGKGPIFLCINLALGLVFGFWGMGLYYNRLSFDKIAQDNDKEINSLKKSLADAEKHWKESLVPLVRAESLRPRLQSLYADHLQNLREGNKPIQALVLDKGGSLKLEANGFPQLGPVLNAGGESIVGLKSIKLLNNDYTQVAAANKQVIDQTEAKLKEEQQLNQEIGNGTKGLRAELAKKQLEERNSLQEKEDLLPLLYNRQVEAQLLAKRKKALETRLQELQSVRVAEQPLKETRNPVSPKKPGF
jgi:hypothetical protein